MPNRGRAKVDALQAYLNSLSMAEQRAFAAAAGTSLGYLRKKCSTRTKLGAELCSAIEEASAGRVTRRDLRPRDWMLVWPELRTAQGAQAVG